MSVKAVVLRSRADLDLSEAVDHYLKEAGEAVALRLLDTIEKAFRQIARHAAGGSPTMHSNSDCPAFDHGP